MFLQILLEKWWTLAIKGLLTHYNIVYLVQFQFDNGFVEF